MERWVDVLISGLEMIAILFTFDAFFQRRFCRNKFWAFVALLFPVHYFFIQIFSTPISYIKIAVLSISLLLVNLVLYHGRMTSRVLVTVLSYVLLYLIEFFGQFITLTFLKIDYKEYWGNRVLYSACGISMAFICVGIACILKHFHKPLSYPMQGSYLWGILAVLFPISSFALQLPLFYLVSTQHVSPMWAATNCVIMIVANLLIFWIIGLLEKNIQIHEETLALSERIHTQAESIRALSAAYSNQRKLTHDFRQYLQVLAGMLQRNEIGSAQEFIEELQEKQSERSLLINTHNAAMDAILNQKAYTAKKAHIDLHFEVNDLSPLKMKSIDYTVVIANLFDNAIEACSKLEESKRWIEVKALYDKSFGGEPAKLFLSIVNSSLPVNIVDEHIQTTKKDSNLHGFGIPNVKSILDRYGAVYVMQYMDSKFQFSIDWPDKIINDD